MAAALEAVLGGTDDLGAGGGLGGRRRLSGEAVGRNGIRGLSRALSTQPPVAPAPTSHAKDQRTFSIIYCRTVTVSNSPSWGLAQTLFQPEPPLRPAWQAATSSRSHIPRVALLIPKLGPQRVPPSPDLELVGVKVNGSIGVGPDYSKGVPAPPSGPQDGSGNHKP